MLAFFCLNPAECEAGDFERVLEDERFVYFCDCCGDPRVMLVPLSVTCEDFLMMNSELTIPLSYKPKNKGHIYFVFTGRM